MMPHLYIIAAGISSGDLPKVGAGQNTLSTILGIVFAIAGALALLMITISGLRYILSAGDPERASKARNGIVYALVGLLIAITAEAIVAYVTNSFLGAGSL